MAKNNNLWILIGVIIVAVIILNQPKGTSPVYTPAQSISYNANVNQNPSYSVSISLVPDRICLGEFVTGTITSNMPNGICSIYANTGRGYMLFSNAQLDINGRYSATSPVNSVGSALFRAICLLNGQYKISNEASLIVEACSQTPPAETNCNSECSNSGYYSGGYFSGGVSCEDFMHYLSNSQCCCKTNYNCEEDCQALDYDTGKTLEADGTCSSGTKVTMLNCCCENEASELPCSSIFYPVSQRTCDAGYCAFGDCYYQAATLSTPARCGCGV